MPNPSSPFVTIDGLSNMRDIGGWAITVDKNSTPTTQVRKAILYRGEDTSTISDKGVAKLHELGISIIFDIRSQQQIDRVGGPRELEGIRRVWIPVFGQEEYTPEKAGLRYQQYAGDGTDGIVQAFTEILVHGGPTTFRTIMLHLASLPPNTSSRTSATAPTACMMHCTTGNNRSGVFIGVLLSLLGLSPASIAAEYSLSNEGLAPTRHSAVARLIKNPVFAAAYGDEAKARAERMKWGSAQNYFREVCGLSQDEIKRVRECLTDKIVDSSKSR
ncbi:putative tyrosine-protein phosphatase [Crepidotus variabilis]|uniref:Tyrosine-protein phosphatase n=1 Tax=Crepidotus variabilis TaxID=179855 RepID=A0A9P6EA50_9AGAR|nr:putative tyrosine-protein phosphatase [Crepidotus variabilis]